MRNSRKDNKKSERYSTLSGVVLTVTLHALAFVFVSFTGLKYIYPPPEEKSILIDFSEDIVEPQQYKGAEPMSDEIDLQNPVKLAQRSESPQESNSPNLTPETTPDDFGDVPVPVPETESKPALDPRASFPGMARKTLPSRQPTALRKHPTSSKTDSRTATRTKAEPRGSQTPISRDAV